VRLDLAGLLLELAFGRGQLLLHLRVHLHKFGHYGHHGLGLVGVGGRQLLVDLFHPMAMLAHVGRHPGRQIAQAAQSFAGVLGRHVLLGTGCCQMDRNQTAADPPAKADSEQSQQQIDGEVEHQRGHFPGS